tara:strand:- start:1924 stop:2703 length:780 start_codon:yes stop_codon:yes gene_type:complete
MLVYMENEIINIFTNGTWYHSVNYKNIKSNGTFDYTDLVYNLNFPTMKGLTVLDVGCSDGFFSKFFLEELKAEKVTGVDFNLYDGSVAFEVLNSNEEEYKEKYNNQNDYENLKFSYESLGLLNSNKFELLKKVFNLNMDYKFGSIYDLSDFKKHDVTFCGSLLEHLRDPVTAIEQLYSSTEKFTIIDISNSLTGIYNIFNRPLSKYTGAGGNFYHHSEKAISLMMKAVGFKDVRLMKRYKIKIEKYGYKIPHAIIIGFK